MASTSRPPKKEIPEQIRLRMEYLREQGLDYAFDRRQVHPVGGGETSEESAVLPMEPKNAMLPPAHSDPVEALRAVRDELGECRRCRLCEKRTQIVFGVGNPRARLMFVGEGPGEEEDRQGIPFVGRAGQLLTDIITKGMGIKREDVYIANVVKCRPPGNRTPLEDEMETCYPFLRAQILAIRPEVLVTLGAPAAHTLMMVETPISRIRGTWTSYEGIALMPTFHPSYLLRNPAAKKFVWEDVQKVLAKLGLDVPKRE
jgi:uracil-DNA glycosylase